MIGVQVEFPVDLGDYRLGTVKDYDPDTGAMTVMDQSGFAWRGYEDQVAIDQAALEGHKSPTTHNVSYDKFKSLSFLRYSTSQFNIMLSLAVLYQYIGR